MDVRGARLVLLVFAVASCKRTPPATPVLASNETWCPEGFESGPQDTCFAIPDAHDAKTPILVYLHGMFEGHGSPQRDGQWAVVREATSRGFAVIIPRGKRGLCAWKAELKDRFCWPTETEDPESFRSVVAEWDKVLWQVDALLEGGPHKRYVLGFSNGGMFAEYLAAENVFSAQGWAIVNAGALIPPPKQPKAAPILLMAAENDAAETAKMKELHDDLGKVGWVHAWCTRPGDAVLATQDVETALKFFKRDADGALKPQNGGYACP